MKLIDLISLGHKHVSAHKRQSFLAVSTISLLFGAALGVVILFEGLENVFIANSDILSGNKIHLIASSCTNGGTCLEWNDIQSLASKKAGSYGGNVVGKLSYYEYKNGDKSFYVVDEKFVENLIEIDLGEYGSNALFKLISLDEADRLVNGGDTSINVSTKVYSADEIRSLKEKTLGKEFTETYLAPKTSPVSAEPVVSDTEEPAEAEYETKELSYIVAGVIGTSRTPMSIAQKYGDVRLLDFFLNRVNRSVVRADLYVSLSGSTNYDAIFETVKSENPEAAVADFSLPIIEFSSFEDAYDFYETENCALERNLDKCSSFTLSELVGNRLQTKDALESLSIVLRYAGAILLLIAVTISVFTFMRLISENAQSIALYRSLGASTFDIFFIYFAYLVELCFITALVATLLGLGISAVISLKNATVLSAILTSVYAHNVSIGILLGAGGGIVQIYLAILATAPLCSILTIDQLSTKNIAKRIRQS